ncbi:MAG: hypothetical protein ACYC2R_11140 [Burkholderiales bacterium]
MTWFIALLSLVAGIALGYRLPAVLAWWRNYRYRHSFKPSALRPYYPAEAAKTKHSDDGTAAP